MSSFMINYVNVVKSIGSLIVYICWEVVEL